MRAQVSAVGTRGRHSMKTNPNGTYEIAAWRWHTCRQARGFADLRNLASSMLPAVQEIQYPADIHATRKVDVQTTAHSSGRPPITRALSHSEGADPMRFLTIPTN